MKIDRSRVRKGTSEVPIECQQLIDKLQCCSRYELIEELTKINSWTFGKCELLHWAQVLDVFDIILGDAATKTLDNKWALRCDSYYPKEKAVLLCILRFTSLLIEHSFSRHLYNSMEHLLVLLTSNDMNVVLEVLNLLYMFSKRSNFITRLKTDEKECLLSRLQYLAENWGGKENGFGLAECCDKNKEIPTTATTLHVEFHREGKNQEPASTQSTDGKPNLNIIHIEHVDKLNRTPADIMKSLSTIYIVPEDKEMWLFTHIRLASHFANYEERLKCVQARLQALSVLVYSNAIQDSASNLLYNGILEELVEVVELQETHLTDIRCAALKTLTAIIHLDRSPQFPNRRPGSRLNSIIDVTGASQYHGFLPVLVRNCIASLTSRQQDIGQNALQNMKLQDQESSIKKDTEMEVVVPVTEQEACSPLVEESAAAEQKFPVSLTTALFSFLYHLASYDVGGEALVSCGMMESLLQVINWQGYELDHITFVTRAVRVIDLITNMDMQAFQAHGGLNSFINRLEVEVNYCKKDQLYRVKERSTEQQFEEVNTQQLSPANAENLADEHSPIELLMISENQGKSCLPQRAALLKSLLNFLKKAFQDATFSESIRHLMEGPLPSALKNIIANAEYYGPSLFLLATDVVTVYVYQEPALLSSLQDNGLVNVVLFALLQKEVPATREVLGSLPNVFSALCLNARGLKSFADHKPFEKLFQILLSPNYLPAMRRRRSTSEPAADTACNLGNAMDELMRHQPSLRQDATLAIISLLEELVYMGSDPQYVCWRPHGRTNDQGGLGGGLTASNGPASRTQAAAEGSSDDEEEEDEDETSTSSQNAANAQSNTDTGRSTVTSAVTVTVVPVDSAAAATAGETSTSGATANEQREPIALIDYIMNAMKFIDAILSNNSTDDHCREFVQKGGLKPLLRLLGLPNLPADCPVTNPAQAIATVCKSILNLAHEPFIFQEGLQQLGEVLDRLKPLCVNNNSDESTGIAATGGSKLLGELASAPDATGVFNSAKSTPLLHAMNAAHGYVLMFVHVCRTGQTEIRSLSLQHWGGKQGAKVLKGLAELYTALVWESTLLLAYCSDDLIPSECDFTRESIERLNQFFDRCETTQNIDSAVSDMVTPMDVDSGASGNDQQKADGRNLKFIKPLLGASSRLGRALAELFGLLVKLCVGSPVRQRRGQNIIAAPPSPTIYAKKVALALNALLAKGLDCDSLPICTTPKCLLTFLICSVGFTSPMLFDERRFPYYLMLKKFVSMGGQDIFFKTFRWALMHDRWALMQDSNRIGGAIEVRSLPEGTLGFLDAWLTLLEKMVNPKTILESPHVISTRQNASYNFDPLKYLIHIHKLAFENIRKLWENTNDDVNVSIADYGNRITETVLTILKHIYWGEKIIREKLKQEEGRADPLVATNGPSNSRTERDDDNNLRQLMDMGFPRELAQDALLHSNTLEQATDYLLSNPPLSRANATSNMDVDGTEDDQVLQAIAMSLGCNTPADDPNAAVVELQHMLEQFTKPALQMCLNLVSKMPELVHKVCELLVTIMKRSRRQSYRDQIIKGIMQCVLKNAKAAATSKPKLAITNDSGAKEAVIDLTGPDSAVASKLLAHYIHLFILFYEVASHYESRLPAPDTGIFGSSLIETISGLIEEAVDQMSNHFDKGAYRPIEPKWLAPSLLLIDTYAKVALRTERKVSMHKNTYRVWRWFDLSLGRWTYYSTANNKLIDDAYWSGETSVKVASNRKRYTIVFSNMLQMNEDTGNNRPVTMNLATLQHPACSTIDVCVPQEPLTSELSRKERARCHPQPALPKYQVKRLLDWCVRLLHMPINRDLLHSVLQMCARFTRDYEMAKLFVEAGGIKCLLKMKFVPDFGGFCVLATILIRHALEEPAILAYAMDKVIRGRALSTIPPAYRDLVYLCRQLGAAVTRGPEVFFEVAKNILRVDTHASDEPLYSAFPLRVEPFTRSIPIPAEGSATVEVVHDLLDALLEPLVEKRSDDTKTSRSKSSSATEQDDKDGKTDKKEQEEIKPMLPKSVILKILADAVVSYAPIAKVVTDYWYPSGCSSLIQEDTPALAFIFDKILPENENISDADCSTMCRMLIAALASSNHSPDAQLILVNEVKSALARALAVFESSEKHTQIQHICGIISTMIDNCPMPPRSSNNVVQFNNIVKLMLRRGLFNDLAKITHSLDLSSPHTSFTANAALKPLEALSRTINQPGPNGAQSRRRTTTVAAAGAAAAAAAAAAGGGGNAGNTGAASGIGHTSRGSGPGPAAASSSSSSVANDLQSAEEDAENVEDTHSETQADRNDTEGERDRLDEIMEHILEGAAERARNSNSAMEVDDDDDGQLPYDPERDPTEELMSTDSGESDSNASDDNDEDDGNNEDEDAVDVNMEDNDEHDDNNYEDDDNNEGERRARDAELLEDAGLFRVAANERDDDVLMIHYEGDNDAIPLPLPRMIRWNENGFSVPMMEDNSGDHVIIHPLLLSSRNGGAEPGPSTVSRNQRATRARRYQYLFNPRNPNPPVILQRLLGGTNDPHIMANMMTANNILAAPADMTREQARVVIMDNFGFIPPNEEQIDFVDQAGYLFGPSLAATLSHVPPVVHWWNMESKLLDSESVYDCTAWISNRLMPTFIKYRNQDLLTKRAKDEEESTKKRKASPLETPPEKTKHASSTRWRESDATDPNRIQIMLFDSDERGSDHPSRRSQVRVDVTDALVEQETEEDEDVDGVPLEGAPPSNDPTGFSQSRSTATERVLQMLGDYDDEERLGSSPADNQTQRSQSRRFFDLPTLTTSTNSSTGRLIGRRRRRIEGVFRFPDSGSGHSSSNRATTATATGGFESTSLPNPRLSVSSTQTRPMNIADSDNSSISVVDESSRSDRSHSHNSPESTDSVGRSTSHTSIESSEMSDTLSTVAQCGSPLRAISEERANQQNEEDDDDEEVRQATDREERRDESRSEETNRRNEVLELETGTDSQSATRRNNVGIQSDETSGLGNAGRASSVGGDSNDSSLERQSSRVVREILEAAINDGRDRGSDAGTSTTTEPAGGTAADNTEDNEDEDEEIPEGVDPSFLEALPPEIRREVLEQHRMLCLQQRLTAAGRSAESNDQTAPVEDTAGGTSATTSSGGSGNGAVAESPGASTTSAEGGHQEVSPEFLAALPPALQEEVLQQQRLEQQRQAAARAPPNEPVDAHAFFQTLPPSLRSVILSDMEDSQISALPPELAAEAQNLRRDWYARNRQMAQERFLQSNLQNNLSPIVGGRLRLAGRQAHRPLHFQRGMWTQWSREFANAHTVRTSSNSSSSSSQLRVRGRQLLDHEGLACLLILLFTDDPHLNKLRLYRVIRNLCYHAPTREWIINALLAIIEKSVHTKPTSDKKDKRKMPRAGPYSVKLQTDSRHLNAGGNWLTIRMEAALGCAANVFSVAKITGKKSDKTASGNTAISIHPQAAVVVCRNALDLFTALAKAFPACLLPVKLFREDAVEKGAVAPPVKLNVPGQPDFWDILLKLDSVIGKKGKSIAKPPFASNSSLETDQVSFENTVFGRLLNMLGSPVVNKNTQLTDNLLKLLSVTTTGMNEIMKPMARGRAPLTNVNKDGDTPIGGSSSMLATPTNDPPMDCLSLAVNVLTDKNCSEEGLEFTTTLLLNLASCSQDMSLTISLLLLNGALKIGAIVESQIRLMLEDLERLNVANDPKKCEDKDLAGAAAATAGPSTSKGVIYNRFTNEQVVVTASTKTKTACELQLPSMVPLTSKSSSQVFFLRILRVIVQIRNSIKNNILMYSVETDMAALSEELRCLEYLWETLSRCLLELEHAPDHHAVLVLQPAVEAFFLVHSPQQGPIVFKPLDKSSDVGEVRETNSSTASTVARSGSSGGDEDRSSTVTDESVSGNSDHQSNGISEGSTVSVASAPPPPPPPPRVALDNDHNAASDTRQVTAEQQKFLGFAEKHRTVLNQILRQSTAHLADGPFAVLVDHTRILDFDIKRRYFRTELERMDHGIRREETAVHVRRSNVFEDSFRELFRRAAEEWKNRFYIVFEDEEGQDAGGLLREWYVIISRDIFNPMYALFTVSPGDRVTYMINSASHYNSNHLCYYKFVGRVIAKAIYDNKLLECYFTRSFYKHILGISVKYTDMESEDYSFYRGLVFLMDNDINKMGLELTFSTEISEFGVTETRDLIPNGRHIPVTEENKMEYIRLVCQMKMTGAIKQQLTAFLEGFYDIIPMRLISIFNEQELELLISGLPNVDIDDLKANTEYHKYQSNSLQIQWFWRALRSFDQADRAKFLQFVTGTSKVPLQGFGALEGMNGVQKFQIHRDDRSTDRLPSAHTCFNQLDLPVYETYDKLRAYLLKAIHECSEGFGFA